MLSRGLKSFFLPLISMAIFSLSPLAMAGQATAYPQKTEHFLSLADLHLDPFLSCDQKPCPLIQKLEAAPPSQWQALFARYDTSIPAFGKDSNASLLTSSFAAAKREAQNTPLQFVLVLGDFLAHDYDKKYFQYAQNPSKARYARFVKKTMEFFASELKQAFPKTDVYILIGNNDSDRNDYFVEPHGAFLKDLSDIQASLLHHPASREACLQEFPRGGYYAVNAPAQPGLRLLFLNSVLFSTKAKGPQVAQAAKEQLDWLHQELDQAKQKKQKVLIAMHIPTGIDVFTTLFLPLSIIEFWKTPYSKRFLNELQQASSQVMGVFQAHLHADAFQILSVPGQKPLPFTGTPSISPIFGNNPGFKIYSYSVPDLNLVNFVTYYRTLQEGSAWEKEYDFDEVYQLQHGADEMIQGMLKLSQNGELAERYKNYYSLQSNSQPITKNNKWLPYYWCATQELTAAKYRACLYSSTESLSS